MQKRQTHNQSQLHLHVTNHCKRVKIPSILHWCSKSEQLCHCSDGAMAPFKSQQQPKAKSYRLLVLKVPAVKWQSRTNCEMLSKRKVLAHDRHFLSATEGMIFGKKWKHMHMIMLFLVLITLLRTTVYFISVTKISNMSLMLKQQVLNSIFLLF